LPRWSAIRGWGLVTGSLLVLLSVAAVGIYAGLYNMAGAAMPKYALPSFAVRARTSATSASIRLFRLADGLTVWPQPGRYSLGHTGIMR
jgi:hypothetical protein